MFRCLRDQLLERQGRPCRFVLDAHDREAVSWADVVGCGVSGSEVRDMMLDAVEKRFGAERAPQPIGWLSDNGSPYTAKESRNSRASSILWPASRLCGAPRAMASPTPSSATFNRDYVRMNPLPDAVTVLRQFDGCFEDYNKNHRHSRLGRRSPREFIRAKSPTTACPV